MKKPKEVGKPLMSYDHGKTKLADNEMLASSEEEMLHGELLSSADMDGFPEIQKLSLVNQGIMCAHAMGYSQRAIADMFDKEQPNVCALIKRVDPKGMIKVTPQTKKAFQIRMLEARAMEALSYITPEKLKAAGAGELTKVSTALLNASQSMQQTKHKAIDGTRLDALIEACANEAVARIPEADVEEKDARD